MEENIKLTDKEEEIMLLLWEYGPCGVKTIIDHMPEPKPHFNTVSTFIHILEQKGCVARKPAGARAYHYYATVPKQSYSRKAIHKLVNNYFGSSFSMVSQLVAERQITPEQLRELLDMIEGE